MKVSSSCLLTHLRNRPSESVIVGSGRVGLGRVGSGRVGSGRVELGQFIRDIGSNVKTNFFFLWTICLSSMLSEICTVVICHM